MTARPLARLLRGARALAPFLLAAAGATCASPGLPPGGPEDHAPPALLRIVPDTGATNARPRAVVFEFDEVVSELPSGRGGGTSASSGSTGLASIVVVSPRDGAPDVDWQRDQVSIRQRRNWRPNTTYTITMLPGLGDLRNNVRDSAIVAWFSTGPTIDAGSVRGIVFDWVAGKPAPRALVEAIAPDSTTYIALADSLGRFVIPRMRPGPYTVRGILDADNDRGLDPREAWASLPADSGAVARSDTTVRLELLAFVHDTLGPRITTVAVRDSLTLRLTFDQPLDPDQALEGARFQVATRDSVALPISAVYSGVRFDTLEAQRQRAAADSASRADTSRARARADSARAAQAAAAAAAQRAGAARDTARRARIDSTPKPSRPSPTPEVVIVLGRPLAPNTFYRISANEQRSVSGRARSSQRTITTPRREARPDSTRRDTTQRPRPDTLETAAALFRREPLLRPRRAR